MDAQDYTNQNTALHIACQNGLKEIVEILATDRTFHLVFNKKNRNGQLALDIAEEKVMDFQGGNLAAGLNAGSQGAGLNNIYRGQRDSTKQDKEENRWW